jgi:cystathionine beta-lyase
MLFKRKSDGIFVSRRGWLYMAQNTRLAAAGRNPAAHKGMVNVPAYRGSTVLFPTVASYFAAGAGEDVHGIGGEGDFSYGTSGNATDRALASAIAELEGAERTVLVPSGLAAISLTMLSFLKSGAHVLVPDTVYGPVRRFCSGLLKDYGVETEYYDPCVGEGVASLFRDNTGLLMLESPGSLTFEMQDAPAMAKAAKAAGIVTAMDNSWASPLCFRPLAAGVDVSIQACTKYMGGHSDVLLGSVSGSKERMKPVAARFRELGICAGPDDCYLVARGLRTLSVRLERHFTSAMYVASELERHPKVGRVLFPPLPSDPGHALWNRDFTGAGGLFSVRLAEEYPKETLYPAVDGMKRFGIGASWGGFESLALPFEPGAGRRRLSYDKASYVRFFVGLEDAEDLLQDVLSFLDKLP